MKAQELVLGGLFFSIIMIAFLGWFAEMAVNYTAPVPASFNNSFNRFSEFSNVPEVGSQYLQNDTFNPVTLFTDITSGVLNVGKLFLSLPLIVYNIMLEAQILVGFPIWIAHFVNVILLLAVFIMLIVLIAKVNPRDD